MMVGIVEIIKLEVIDGKLKVSLEDNINLHGLAGIDKVAVTGNISSWQCFGCSE